MASSPVGDASAPHTLSVALLGLVLGILLAPATRAPATPSTAPASKLSSVPRTLPYSGPADPAQARHLGLGGLQGLMPATPAAATISAAPPASGSPDPADQLWWTASGCRS